MIRRFTGTFFVAVLAVAAVAAVSSAQQVNVGAPNSQVDQYVPAQPTGGGGHKPLAPVAGPTGNAGQLAFTGLNLLPLVMIGSLLVCVALALRRREHLPTSA